MKDYESINLEQKVSENDPFTEERYAQFHYFFPKHCTKILDVGCNTGKGGVALKKINSKFVLSGIDVVKERLNNLPKDVYVDNIYGSCTKIPSEDDEFDVVVAGEFVEHLYAIDVGPTLFEMFRVLKIGGRVLLTTPNPSYVRRRLRRQSLLGGPHVSQHHHDALKMMMRMAGFSRVRVYGSGKATRYLGYRFPLLSFYGSYLIMGDKI